MSTISGLPFRVRISYVAWHIRSIGLVAFPLGLSLALPMRIAPVQETSQVSPGWSVRSSSVSVKVIATRDLVLFAIDAFHAAAIFPPPVSPVFGPPPVSPVFG